MGKDVGNDFFEGKVTLPIILTLEKCDENDRKTIADLFAKNLMQNERNYDDFKTIMHIMEKYNGLEMAKNLAKQQHQLAIKNLEIFPNSVAKENLITVLEYSAARIF